MAGEVAAPPVVNTEVSQPQNWEDCLQFWKGKLPELIENFRAGRLALFSQNWHKLTTDKWIVSNITQGCTIEFHENPAQYRVPREIIFSAQETEVMDMEIKKYLRKGIIVASQHEKGEYISNVFLRPKKDGTHRMILNLKSLNDSVTKRHFKMQTLNSVLQLMKPNCFMASIDWKDAYFCCPVHKHFQKFLKFTWKGTLYQFVCLPNGLSSAPRLFTKLTKPVLSHLREMGHINSIFIDDVYVQGDTELECRTNVMDTVQVSLDAGFVPHPVKSVFMPTQSLLYLGFILNSVTMTVQLTEEKIMRLKSMCALVGKKENIQIRQLAELVGLMVAAFPAVQYARLYYRVLDNEKSHALATHKGNFDEYTTISDEAKSDLNWWIQNQEFRNFFQEFKKFIRSNKST